MHLGLILENIEGGEETYAIHASNEPLIDEIDRSSDKLWKLEGCQLEGKKSRLARTSFSRFRTLNNNFSGVQGPICKNSIDSESCTIQ